MTKQELIQYIGDKAGELSEDGLNELASYADYLRWREVFGNVDTQLKEAREDYEKGDVVSLADAKKELGIE
jgi:vacuolar-type H+-ATPase subunit C/Vma6